jgi:hypothetical protein
MSPWLKTEISGYNESLNKASIALADWKSRQIILLESFGQMTAIYTAAFDDMCTHNLAHSPFLES